MRIKGHEIEFYDGIKDMPQRKFIAMQAALLQASGVGSTMEDVNKHFLTLDTFLAAGQIKEAITERQNLQLNIFASLNAIDFNSEALAYLVSSIDGKEAGTDSKSIKELTTILSELPKGQFDETLTELKKKLILN